MAQVIRMHAVGGPEVLVPEEQDPAAPAPGEVRIRQVAAGLNYVDIYHRTGLYALPGLPAVPGVEAAGVVEAIGEGVTGFAPGDRVAYAGLPAGAYATFRCLPADRLVRLPEGIDATAIAGAMLRGLTAHMLLHRVHAVRPGETVLIHAAAGGLGLILAQWAKRLGARVIGTVGSAAKADIALAHGVDHAVPYREEDFVAAVRRLTDGRGADYAIDGIGGETLLRTLDAVRPFGTVASVGQVGGPVRPIEITELGPKRSLALARPSVFAYAADPASYRTGAAAFLAEVEAGLQLVQGGARPLRDAAAAHRAMEGRETIGTGVLVM